MGIYFQATGELNWLLTAEGFNLNPVVLKVWPTCLSRQHHLDTGPISDLPTQKLPEGDPAAHIRTSLLGNSDVHSRLRTPALSKVKSSKPHIRYTILRTGGTTGTCDNGMKGNFHSRFQEDQKEKKEDVFKRFALWHLTAFQDHLLMFY